jgi:hypothetical protein
MRAMRAIGEKGLLAMLCSMLMAFQPVFGTPAAQFLGTMNGSGPLELNGITVPTGTLVYSGNRIETSPQGSGYMALAQGGRIILGQSTSAQVVDSSEGYWVRLDHGVIGAVSSAKAPIVITAGGITVRTKKATGTFEVSLNGSSLKVVARHGSALVVEGNRTIEIPEGKAIDATVGPSSGTVAGGSHTLLITGITVAAVAGGVLGGLGAAGTFSGGSCVSTSQLSCQ